MAKRFLDILLAFPALLLLSPVFAAVSLLILIENGFPVFFRQIRVGLKGKEFRIYKFRTMHEGSQVQGSITVRGDPRVTRVGAFLRRYKLDELPQLMNVLKGEMSLVGPRPEVPEYVHTYPEQDKETVLSVRPGLTDYAALEFRNEGELLDAARDPERIYLEEILPRKLALYRRYVEHAGFVTDVLLILRTIKVLCSRRG